MKKYAFKGLGLVLAVALIVGCFAGCAKINYVTDGAIQAINEVKDGSWKTKGQEDAGTSEADYDKPVIEEFKAGTYGGVEFKDVAAVADYYKQAYDYTKTLTAQYKDDKGQTQTYYKMLCEEDLDVHDIAIDGSVNKTINGHGSRYRKAHLQARFETVWFPPPTEILSWIRTSGTARVSPCRPAAWWLMIW